MKMFSMKKLFLFSILLTVMGLVACGDSSSSSDSEDECTVHPGAPGCDEPAGSPSEE